MKLSNLPTQAETAKGRSATLFAGPKRAAVPPKATSFTKVNGSASGSTPNAELKSEHEADGVDADGKAVESGRAQEHHGILTALP